MAGSRLTVGLIAPPWVPVPPSVYGGTELVLDLLARGIQDAGHEVVLFATGDSTCPVVRRWAHPAAVGTTAGTVDELVQIEAAYSSLQDVDVIHDHTMLGPLWSAATTADVPVVTTVHARLTPPLAALYRAVAPVVAIVAISRHQRDSAPSVPVRAVIHHGVDVAARPFGAGSGGYVLFLGRMHPDKGVHRAISIARAAGKRLLIAAKMWEPPEQQYFDTTVRPLLGQDAQYLGPVGHHDKLTLLANAEALLNPIRWPEPFGLVMIEALAAGTPVLAFAEGAAPEIVQDGITGYLCSDDLDMAYRLSTIGAIDRTACRRSAEERFTSGRMVREHLELYADLIHRGADPPERTLRLAAGRR